MERFGVFEEDDAGLSRRRLLGLGMLGAAGFLTGPAVARPRKLKRPLAPFALPPPIAQPIEAPTAPITLGRGIRPSLFKQAQAALERHGSRIHQRDLIGIADFRSASAQPRFHLVDMINGGTTTLLVSHGRGSDPDHLGWVQRFSNDFGSLASSEGAYLTSDLYVGKHGRSRRLVGLDPTNSNAEPRAVVVHAAWYVCPEVVAQTGKCGRSEGCFAVSEADLDQVLTRLGPGRMIYASKA